MYWEPLIGHDPVFIEACIIGKESGSTWFRFNYRSVGDVNRNRVYLSEPP